MREAVNRHLDALRRYGRKDGVRCGVDDDVTRLGVECVIRRQDGGECAHVLGDLFSVFGVAWMVA